MLVRILPYQQSAVSTVSCSWEDAHPSFFAHLPHLRPSGGDFKTSGRNCRDNRRTDGYLQLVPESVWVSVAVGEALLGNLGLAQLRQHGLQRGLEGVHLLKHGHGWFRPHHLQYLQRNWDIFIRFTKTVQFHIRHETSAWWDAREKTQLKQNISLLHSDSEFKV